MSCFPLLTTSTQQSQSPTRTSHSTLLSTRLFASSRVLGMTQEFSSTLPSIISSIVWPKGELLYRDDPAISYSNPLRDHGVICTLDNPVYLTRVKGKTVHCLDRSARPRTITIDPTEYRFKLALLRNNYEEMLYIIRTSNLLGQSIIAYLQQKGFPEVQISVFNHGLEGQLMRLSDCSAFCARQKHSLRSGYRMREPGRCARDSEND